jgi:hypothetical protein
VSVLKTIEQKIEGLFEGIFGRAFRANVQPVELARKLVKELEDHRMTSVSRVYVPNEYTVYLSPDDRAQFTHYESQLRAELQEYLAEHARREGYALLSAPVVLLETDADLQLGEFGIATRMVQRGDAAERADGPPAPQPPPQLPPQTEPGATMVYKPRVPVETEAASPVELGVAPEVVTLTLDGTAHEVTKRRTVLGRSRECDIQVADANVSRRHAEIRQEGAAYWLVDLESTNGSQVNGRRTAREKLASGDRVTLGSTDIVFERRLAE